MIPRRPFGRTGHDSSRVIFGAAALGAMSQARTDQTMETVLEFGVNHIDTAAAYGESEVRLRPFLADHRREVFLATKTGERDGASARRELERSLHRMDVEYVDLVQLHNLVEPDEFDVAHGRGGALEALVKARDEGLVRHIGVTGHGTRIAEMHLRSLERFDFDSVLLPYNFVMMSIPAYAHMVEQLLSECGRRGVAVQAIKSIARRRWPEASTEPHYSWYEPLPPGDALARGIAYVLSREQLFLNSSSDGRLLRPTLEAASRDLQAPSDVQLANDVDDFNISALFDGGALERI